VQGGSLRRRALAVGLATAIALLIGVAPAAAQTVKLAPFGGHTFSSPNYVTGTPGDRSRVFVVEGGGTIRLVKNGVTQSAPFLTIPEVYKPGGACGECGLFSIAFAPDYATSGRFYVFYTRDSAVPTEQHYLRIEEFHRSAANPDLADPSSRRIVLEIPHLEGSAHNGGQLQFGPDGLLYISVGDGGTGGANGQNTGTLLGKLLRINPAGTMPAQYAIPADNPFAGATPGSDEIYSYGLRNPWRFSFDRLTGDLTIGDVGEGIREEIDFMPRGAGRGANFGWNCFEGSLLYMGAPASCTPPPANHTPPVLEYPNPNPGLAAVIGGYVIRDGALPSLLGRYIYADLADVFGGELRTTQLFTNGSSGDSGLGVSATNVVSFGEDACAHIYVSTAGGTVYRLEPTSGAFPCMPQTSLPTLTVNIVGSGTGKVTGPGINCPGDCTRTYNNGTPVTLNAAGTGRSTFVGWGGACSGTGSCELTMDADKSATATFNSGSPTCKGIPASIVGTDGGDVRSGTPGADVIVGLGGNDKLSGLAGNDLICGGAGKDILKGGKGNDKLYGQKGKDTLKGGPSKDKLKGGAGKDLCKGGKGKDTASKCEVEKSI
jgi:glucose/arabinose dehydrogenase